MYPNHQVAIPGYPNPAAMGYSAKPARPTGHGGWAVATLIFFWPLAFTAANHASQVSLLWADGDYAGAQYASDRAKKLGKIALLLAVIGTALLVLLYVAIFAAAMSAVGDASSYSNY